ncbi:MAG: hypothetical protein IJO98_09785 [Clostridia bacterium]|nr:hypothetical protein [Clostridia bacterium]
MANQERDNSIYDSLKWSHADLTKDLNFSGEGKTAEEVYRKLKIRIRDEYYVALNDQSRLYKAMWICIALTVAWFLIGALLLQSLISDGVWAGSFLVLIGLIVMLYKWARGYDSKFQAYRDFDEDFFGGEVFYKLSRGIKL